LIVTRPEKLDGEGGTAFATEKVASNTHAKTMNANVDFWGFILSLSLNANLSSLRPSVIWEENHDAQSTEYSVNLLIDNENLSNYIIKWGFIARPALPQKECYSRPDQSIWR